MMYMTLPGGQPVSRLSTLLPHIINPEALSDEELTALGVARVVVTRPPAEWWQTYGEPVTDDTVRPVVITYPVVDRPLEEVQELAWELIKDERTERQSGFMPFTFPGGIANTVEMNKQARDDLTAQTTAAVGMLVAGIPGTLIWTSFENITHQMTPTEMFALGMAGGQFVAGIHAQSQVLREQIESAQTVAGVVAVVWSD